ncbi:hypothetical protein Xcel_3454 (plasmid) [Xylanimonas cellulosilytica DSM 15894]|uniref:Uncharacterized protein n=1 Tax=Xylanimonas cellulosilytica (strain DSM 15894 / JCM 12276 / CECT 5975 / KCTC 9989 / LMG 20990 / NBRC 107835 / XIL07) TaxID=446471 RepID=D1C0Y7_XYLCX|nr:hypothetical protein [Xylanimonas cellulosilytica]ACZ32453.1 hypothetical protein Xcel_3454 [Xylanimonas cellulosilytica DSM 15894]
MTPTTWILAILAVPVLAIWAGLQLRQVARSVPGPADLPVLAPTSTTRPRRPLRRWSQAGFASLQLDTDQRRRPPSSPAPPLPHVLVVPVVVAGKADPVYDVACSFCGVLSTRVLDVAAQEEATWHRLRDIHADQPAANQENR